MRDDPSLSARIVRSGLSLSREDSREPVQASHTQRLRLLEELAQIGLWSFDVRSGAFTISDGVARLTGLSPQTTRLDALRALVHPEDGEVFEEIAAALRTGIPVDRGFRIVRLDRTVRWVEFKGNVVLGPDACPVRADGILLDVTGRHETTQAVQRNQARYEGLVQAIAAVVWLMSPDGVRRPSPSWCALTGQTAEEWHAGGWVSAIHPDDRQRAAQTWATAFGRSESYEANYRLRRADGNYRWVSSRAVPVRNPDRSVREWIGLVIDMTNTASVMTQPDDLALTEVSGALIRSARAMLDWSIPDLAAAAEVSGSSIKRFEESGGAALRPRTRAAIRQALEAAGITFVARPSGEVGLIHRPSATGSAPPAGA
ncbi:PAS domain-containing protein [Methylobacterium sp. M6A4_1b]